MARLKYLHPYKGVYHVRMVIPERLRPLFLDKSGKPKSNLTETTGERDPKMAEIKALPIIAKFKQQLAQAERGVTEDKLQEIANTVIKLSGLHSYKVTDGRAGLELSEDQITGMIRSLCEARGIQDQQERITQIVLQDGALWRTPVTGGGRATLPVEAPSNGTKLSVFREDYLDRRGFDAKRKLEITRAFRFLERITGDADLKAITPEHVRDCYKLMLAYPVGPKASGVADKLSVAEVLAAYQAGTWTRTMNEETVKKNLSFIRSALEYAANDRLIPANPAVGIRVLDKPMTALRVEKRPFKSDELQTLMLSPLFASCEGSDRVGQLAKPGPVEVRDYRFWMPWVALYTAARLEEVAGLERSNLRQDDGVWFLHIEGTKTDRSVRDVPVHDHLIQLGFLDYAQKQKGRLFPEYEDSAELSKEYSKFFGRYMDKLGLTDREISFHSLRHSWIGEAKHTDIPRDAWQQMSAHQDEKNVGDDYARDERRRMSKLKEYMDRIRFEGITPAPKRKAKPKTKTKRR